MKKRTQKTEKNKKSFKKHLTKQKLYDIMNTERQRKGNKKMKKLKGYIVDDNNYIIGDYKISYEKTEDQLWIYDKDDDLITGFEMPAYLWEYLLEAQGEDKEAKLSFGRYIIKRLGL